MPAGHHRIKYHPMPASARFGLTSAFFHNEASYTEEELQFRLRLLKNRANSAIDVELLQTTQSWFDENPEKALLNINQDSWLFQNEYRPREELSREDFHIGLLNVQRQYWSGLSTMTRVIGDYLILRNKDLTEQYLNQPMNYFLLDLIQILKRLAMIENPVYVEEQLKFLGNYLRSIEILLASSPGSDRLFLADCRHEIENKLQAEIENKLISKQLKTDVEQMQRKTQQVAQITHSILHFALAKDEVNSHPFLEYFVTQQQAPEFKSKFPTLAAQACAASESSQLIQIETIKVEQVILSTKTLDDCPGFKLIEDLSAETKAAYARGLNDLQALVHFQGLLNQLSALLDQAGEVLTLIQFREQILNLLHNLEQLVKQSQRNIAEVIDANDKAYFKFIQAKQDLRWWERLNGKAQQKIDAFITNQDNLARFSATMTALQTANKALLHESGQIINRLNQQASEEQQMNLVSSTGEHIQQLINSMHGWVSNQHLLRGEAIPPRPLLWQEQTPHEETPLLIEVEETEEPELINERSVTSSASQLAAHSFWQSPISTSQSMITAGSAQSNQAAIGASMILALIMVFSFGFFIIKYLFTNQENVIELKKATDEESEQPDIFLD